MSRPDYITASLGEYACTTFGAVRIESTTPSAYRLAKKPDGTLVLQGAYEWSEGLTRFGHEWRDIPTVEDHGN